MAQGQGRSGGRSQGRNSRRNGLRGGGRDGDREYKGKSRDKIVPRNLGDPEATRKRAAKGKGQGQVRDQRPAKRHAPSGGSLIEGRRAVVEALDAHIPILRAYVSQSVTSHDATLDVLVGRLEGEGVRVEVVPRERLDAISSHGAHQGIVAETKPFVYADLEDVIANAGDGDGLVIVLDHVTDEGNFGAIVRSAEIVGAAGVVVAKARSAKVGVGAFKPSAGAVLHVPIAQVPNLATALNRLKKAGFWVGGATEHADQLAWDAPLAGRVALVMGSEGEGISRLVLEKCDFTCKLPQRGVIESLNVAQATTVLAYEWLRRTHGAGE